MSVNITYTNPVYPAYMGDPFVLHHEDYFYAYGTGAASDDGRQFPILRSSNLIDWQAHGWALAPLVKSEAFWAPEVAYHVGIFYLYYSAGGPDGQGHQLRVATSHSPSGPFIDAKNVLTPDDPFSIDAHPFKDLDGQWYLFYSRDFLTMDDDNRIGTGIVVDKLVDMVTLAGDPQVVVRPHADWQIYQPQRPMYGAVYDWYTIEGASLRLHGGSYYCFYSGGAWQRQNYGIAYVVADHPMGPYERPSDLDGAIFHSIESHVYGPGHNSFITLANGDEYIIYHAWNPEKTARLMCVDRLTWNSDKPHLAPTWTPQVLPKIGRTSI